MTILGTSLTEAHGNLHPTVVHESALRDTFRADALAGLALPQKRLDPKYLYDARGSELFEEICRVPEYYPTRTEAMIFDTCLNEVAEVLGPQCTLIEPGSGSGEKGQRLLEALEAPRAFVPMEISGAALADSADYLAPRFPEVEIHPVQADFAAGEALPEQVPARDRVVFFPGSTIGNFTREERGALLRRFADMVAPDDGAQAAGSEAAADGGALLIGFDLVKEPDALRAAYDDRGGVTARFNLNLLDRMNRELDATFKIDRFAHAAPWVAEGSRIEMRLVSRADQEVEVAGRRFAFRAGEYIHTESSHKFTVDAFDDEAKRAGFAPVQQWTDPKGWFCVGLYRRAPTAGAAPVTTSAAETSSR